MSDDLSAIEVGGFKEQLKATTTGRGKVNPIIEGVKRELLKTGQIKQALFPRGHVTDIDSFINKGLAEYGVTITQEDLDEVTPGRSLPLRSIGEHEVRVAAPSLSYNGDGLNSTEYFNRKLRIMDEGVDYEARFAERIPRYMVPDTMEFPLDLNTKFIGLRLPYQHCLFILNPGPDVLLVHCEQIEDATIRLTINKQSNYDQTVVTWDGETITFSGTYNIRFEEDFVKVQAIPAILDGLSKNYVLVEGEQAPKDRAIPEASKGCRVRVLKLHPNAVAIRKEWQGGTHASPREHERAGHWRRNCHGVKVWIGARTINKGVAGRVDKDYWVSKRKKEIPDV